MTMKGWTELSIATCPGCGGHYAASAARCPKCGAPRQTAGNTHAPPAARPPRQASKARLIRAGQDRGNGLVSFKKRMQNHEE